MKTVKIKVNQVIPGYSAGKTVPIKTDDIGIPLDKFWRDRLQDAKTDNCIEIIEVKSKASKTMPSKEDNK